MQRALNEELARHGITFRQWQVLAWLALEGELAQAELAERLGIEAPTLAGILERMQRDGWIVRKECPTDRRKKLVRPTHQVGAGLVEDGRLRAPSAQPGDGGNRPKANRAAQSAAEHDPGQPSNRRFGGIDMRDCSKLDKRMGRMRPSGAKRERGEPCRRGRSARRCVLWTAACLTLLLSVPSARGQSGASLVSVAPVVEREVNAGRTFVGTVVPRRKSTVGSAVDGRVIEFPVNEGQRVEAGDVLAQLLTETLEIQIAGAKAELSLRREELAELENGSRPEEIHQAKARMLHSEAAKKYWQTKLARYRDLFERGQSVSQEELQETESSAEQALQSFEEAKAAWDLAVVGPRPERIAQARARMLTQQEGVRRLEDMRAKHTIRARFDGYVVAEHTEVGAWLSQGDPVVEVVDLDEVDVEVPVLEDYVSFLEIGMETRVELGALADRAFTGRVAQIVPQADVRARTFPVKVRVPNERRGGTVLLKAGMFARVTLPLGRVEHALLVPKDALVLGGRTPSVYAVVADAKNPKQGTVRPVEVELGVADGNLIQVKPQGGFQNGARREALAAGAHVVVRGNERLRPGEAVTIAEVLPTEPQASSEAADRAAAGESR